MLTYQINIDGDAICSSELLHGQRHHCFFYCYGYWWHWPPTTCVHRRFYTWINTRICHVQYIRSR